MPPTISIQSREESNNRSMLAPQALSIRPISLGSLEILRQLANPLATAEADLSNIDTRTLAEFIWVHAAEQEEVLDTVYNTPTQVARKAAAFAFAISPAQLKAITASLAADRASVQAASAEALPDDSAEQDSPNALTPRS